MTSIILYESQIFLHILPRSHSYVGESCLPSANITWTSNFSSSKSKAHLNPKFSFLFSTIFEDGTIIHPITQGWNSGFLPPLILTPKDFPKPAEQINVLLWFRPLRPFIQTITRMHPVFLQTVHTAVRKVFLKSKSEWVIFLTENLTKGQIPWLVWPTRPVKT